MVVTDESSRGASSLFSWQKLSLDRAVAPLLKEPVAPFVSRNHERKRALLNATYYSECFLHAIGPVDADTAALDAQSRYEKWWVESKYRGTGGSIEVSSGSSNSTKEEGSNSSGSNKRRKVTAVQAGPASFAVQIRDDDDGDLSDAALQQPPASIVPIHSIPDALVEPDHDHDDDADDSSDRPPRAPSIVAALKAALVEDLRQSGGDVSTPHFVSCLDRLHELYQASKKDERWGPSSATVPSDGTWIALSKPTFTECRGRNGRGQCLYTLGRLSFDMFRPTSLLCSLRGVFNTVSLPEDAVTTTNASNASTSSISSGDDETGDGDRGGRDASERAASAASASVEDGASSASASMRRPRTCPSRMVRSLQDRYGKAGAPVRTYEYVRYSCRFNLLPPFR
jgi:hypothetical protein